MFSRTRTRSSTGSCWDGPDSLRAALDRAEAVVVGGGAGLSAAAGFDYGGARFRARFADFEAKYGFHDMYALCANAASYAVGFFPLHLAVRALAS